MRVEVMFGEMLSNLTMMVSETFLERNMEAHLFAIRVRLDYDTWKAARTVTMAEARRRWPPT